jgi:hypothetical protein
MIEACDMTDTELSIDYRALGFNSALALVCETENVIVKAWSNEYGDNFSQVIIGDRVLYWEIFSYPAPDVCDGCHHRDDPEVFGAPCGQCGPDANDVPTHHSRRGELLAALRAPAPRVDVWVCDVKTIDDMPTLVTALDMTGDGVDDYDGISIETAVYFPFPAMAGVDVVVYSGLQDVTLGYPEPADDNLDHYADAMHEARVTRCGTCASFAPHDVVDALRGFGHCAKGDMNVSVMDYPGYGCYEPCDDGPAWATGGSS